MADESHGERIVRLETQHLAAEEARERLSNEIAEFIRESREARKDHEVRHVKDDQENTEDHRRLHRRISDEVATVRTLAERATLAIRDGKNISKGAAWAFRFMWALLGAGGGALILKYLSGDTPKPPVPGVTH